MHFNASKRRLTIGTAVGVVAISVIALGTQSSTQRWAHLLLTDVGLFGRPNCADPSLAVLPEGCPMFSTTVPAETAFDPAPLMLRDQLAARRDELLKRRDRLVRQQQIEAEISSLREQISSLQTELQLLEGPAQDRRVGP
jgi:hypothetical protein